ncbi:MAG: beta-glycosidase [Bacteroidales bacterium]|nr:beta-glycosidase [Bacteroidales bacterium]
MRRLLVLLAVLLSVLPSHGRRIQREVIDLSGAWEFALDPSGTLNQRFQTNETVHLPGTTDTNLKGQECTDFTLTSHLSRRFSYTGAAWYRRDFKVPRRLKDVPLVLTLERSKCTEVYIDGIKAGECNDISTAQKYSIPPLSKGIHTVAVKVDNGGGVPPQVISSSHMYSEDTQTNWNGIIGVIAISSERISPEKKEIRSSMSRLTINDGHFSYNGKREFLRGRHDACVFPLTGHTPMDYPSWKEYFSICKRYGLNHVRFHSWCPPEECFRAADDEGIHLQPELPFWGTLDVKDTSLVNFLLKEGKNILKEYSRHPSFSLFSLGNELWGDKDLMKEMIRQFREVAPDVLFTNGTNAFLGYEGYVEGTDFMATCRVGGEAYGEYGTHTRSSFSFADAADGGILNHFPPSSSRDFSQAIKASPVPVISHESGQFQTYPDYSEIDKYTGVLAPYNLQVFRRRLDEKGLGSMDKDFRKASGALSALLYKADIEMCLRTEDLGGFQLLDLQDYPGQGSAYVGILDAFMDDKGIAPPQWWRQFCSPVVPLAIMDKFCWDSSEEFSCEAKIANYSGKDLGGKELRWALTVDGEPAPFKEGTLRCPNGEGLLEAGSFTAPLGGIMTPVKATLSLHVPGTVAFNTWDIWIFHHIGSPAVGEGITIAEDITPDVMRALENGESVLYMPSQDNIPESTVGGLFQTDYWNYRMFKTICEDNGKPVSPGTLGLLIDEKHPLFLKFPTSNHSSWQWFPMVKESHPLIIDGMEGLEPIVRVIDNIERSHSLALVFEARVGNGRILVCMSDLEKVIREDNPPVEALDFHSALLDYMHSPQFSPSYSMSIEDLLLLTGRMPVEREIGRLGNISYE